MENKSILMVGVLFLFGIMLVSFVSAEPIIDQEVEEALQNQSKIRVIIEFNQSLPQNILDVVKNETLVNLSEFVLKQNIKDSYWFSGEITKAGLDKLRMNKNIVRIFEEKGGVTFDNEKNETIDEEGEVGVPKNKLWWMIIPILIILFTIIYLIIKKKR